MLPPTEKLKRPAVVFGSPIADGRKLVVVFLQASPPSWACAAQENSKPWRQTTSRIAGAFMSAGGDTISR